MKNYLVLLLVFCYSVTGLAQTTKNPCTKSVLLMKDFAKYALTEGKTKDEIVDMSIGYTMAYYKGVDVDYEGKTYEYAAALKLDRLGLVSDRATNPVMVGSRLFVEDELRTMNKREPTHVVTPSEFDRLMASAVVNVKKAKAPMPLYNSMAETCDNEIAYELDTLEVGEIYLEFVVEGIVVLNVKLACGNFFPAGFQKPEPEYMTVDDAEEKWRNEKTLLLSDSSGGNSATASVGDINIRNEISGIQRQLDADGYGAYAGPSWAATASVGWGQGWGASYQGGGWVRFGNNNCGGWGNNWGGNCGARIWHPLHGWIGQGCNNGNPPPNWTSGNVYNTEFNFFEDNSIVDNSIVDNSINIWDSFNTIDSWNGFPIDNPNPNPNDSIPGGSTGGDGTLPNDSLPGGSNGRLSNPNNTQEDLVNESKESKVFEEFEGMENVKLAMESKRAEALNAFDGMEKLKPATKSESLKDKFKTEDFAFNSTSNISKNDSKKEFMEERYNGRVSANEAAGRTSVKDKIESRRVTADVATGRTPDRHASYQDVRRDGFNQDREFAYRDDSRDGRVDVREAAKPDRTRQDYYSRNESKPVNVREATKPTRNENRNPDYNRGKPNKPVNVREATKPNRSVSPNPNRGNSNSVKPRGNSNRSQAHPNRQPQRGSSTGKLQQRKKQQKRVQPKKRSGKKVGVR